jgi:hypothetical protein
LVLPEELRRNGGGPRMRSALQGWTCALRGRGAQSTGSGSLLSLPLPDDEDDSTNMLLIVPVGISSPNSHNKISGSPKSDARPAPLDG